MQATTFPISSLSIAPSKRSTQSFLEPSFPLSPVSEDYREIVFESWLGQLFPSQGLLLLDETAQLLQSNSKAREICRLIGEASTDSVTQPVTEESITLPQQVATLCEFLIDGRREFPDRKLQLSDEIFSDNGLRVQLNAEWVAMAEQPATSILVRLEDVVQIANQRAFCDAYRYGFTPRETEVWALYLQGLPCRQVGEQLFIALCTVKKHMKSISRKRRGEMI